jgi:hypothetical protein
MKIRTPFLTLLAAGALFAAQPSRAAEKEHEHSRHNHAGHDHAGHNHGGHEHAKAGQHAHDSAAPHRHAHVEAGSGESLAALRSHVDAMEKELASGDLKGIHGHDEAIQAVARTLGADTTLKGDNAKRIQGFARNIAKLSGKMHLAADKKDLEQARKEFGKLKAQLGLLEKHHGQGHVHGTDAKQGSSRGDGKPQSGK